MKKKKLVSLILLFSSYLVSSCDLLNGNFLKEIENTPATSSSNNNGNTSTNQPSDNGTGDKPSGGESTDKENPPQEDSSGEDSDKDNPSPSNDDIIPLALSLDSTKYEILTGNSVTAKVTYVGNSVENPTFNWLSSNTSIASVTSSGVIKGINAGSCDVIVYCDINNNLSFELGVDIYAKASVVVAIKPEITNKKNIICYSETYKDDAVPSRSKLPVDLFRNFQMEINTISTEGDIPYISLEDVSSLFRHFYFYMYKESDYAKYAKLKTENGKYRIDLFPTNYYITDSGGNTSYRRAPLYFDIKNNQISCSDFTKFYSITSTWNKELPNDMCSPYGIVKFSDSSKALSNSKNVVFDLDKYGMKLYEFDGKGYLPLHLALSLNSEFSSYYYDGSLVCSPNALKGQHFSFLYSGKTKFSIQLPADVYNISNAYYTFTQSKTNPNYYSFSYKIANNIYHNGKAEFNNGKVTFTVVRASNSTSFDYNSKEGLVNKTYNYTKDGDLITLKNTDNSIAHYIRLTDNDYCLEKFKDKMKVFNYNFLVFRLDHYYGLKEDLGITSFDTFFKNNSAEILDYQGKQYKKDTLYNLIMNAENINEYNYIIYYIIENFLGDGHTNMTNGSPFSEYDYFINRELRKENLSSRYSTLTNKASEYSKARNSNPTMKISGKTAILQFDSFDGQLTSKGTYTKYKALFEKDGISDYSSRYSYYLKINTLIGMFYAFYVIGQKSEITNVVFDVTNNGGGAVLLLPQLLAFMTKDPTVVFKDTLNDFMGEYHYVVDLNDDGVFAGEGDTYQGKYKFFILQSDFSFSCGTAFPTVCRNNNCAKIIGSSTSGGGTCPVSLGYDAVGSQYRVSARYNIMITNDGGKTYTNNDKGVTADKTLSSQYWYNYSYLNNWLNSNF